MDEVMTTIVKIVCSWCNEEIGVKDGKSIYKTTHSICDKCLNKLMQEINEKRIKRNNLANNIYML